jgi:hypothetical protein
MKCYDCWASAASSEYIQINMQAKLQEIHLVVPAFLVFHHFRFHLDFLSLLSHLLDLIHQLNRNQLQCNEVTDKQLYSETSSN